MLVKVCGLLDNNQVELASQTGPDMLGINFYPPSSRYYSDASITKISTTRLVGVFVGATKDEILRSVAQYELDSVQLHGDEEAEFCLRLNSTIPVIKVFRVDEHFDFSETAAFEGCDRFLFDTKTDLYGGSGKKFDWHWLDDYRGSTPFLLSGGIGPDDAENLLRLTHPSFEGVDINSRFELKPGIKKMELVSRFIEKIKNKDGQLSR